jgi:hypothetical protein
MLLDVFRPLGRELDFVRNVKLASVPEEVGTVSSSAAVCALPRIDLRGRGESDCHAKMPRVSPHDTA